LNYSFYRERAALALATMYHQGHGLQKQPQKARRYCFIALSGYLNPPDWKRAQQLAKELKILVSSKA
jgi:aspartate/methionine/tyrosine aminotransferase